MSTTLLDKREVRIRKMFGAIAPTYDLLNHLLSMNVDRFWRWRTTKLVPPKDDGPILDLCTGTGDLALAYQRASRGRAPIVGADFCGEMLDRATHKVSGKNGQAPPIRFVQADAQRLPFSDNLFQIVCVAFGLRNVTDTPRRRPPAALAGRDADESVDDRTGDEAVGRAWARKRPGAGGAGAGVSFAWGIGVEYSQSGESSMRNLVLQIDDETGECFARIAAERGMDAVQLLAELLTTFVRREELARKGRTDEFPPISSEEHEEDLQLAEWSMADLAARLQEEDEA